MDEIEKQLLLDKLVNDGYLEHKIIDGQSHYRLTEKGEKEAKKFRGVLK